MKTCPILLTSLALFALPPAAPAMERTADGVLIKLDDGRLMKIEPRAENIVRIEVAPSADFFNRPDAVMVAPGALRPSWSATENAAVAELSTARLKVRIALSDGAVSFLDKDGAPILSERGGARLDPAEVQGVKTYHVQQQWEPEEGESLYGLGQQQLGLLDLKGYPIELWQHNGTVAIPFMVSSRGYGILWNNLSYTRFGDFAEPRQIDAPLLSTAEGVSGGLTGSYYADGSFTKLVSRRIDSKFDFTAPESATLNLAINPALPPKGDISVRWEGFVTAPRSGDFIFRTFATGDTQLWIDGKRVVNHWRQSWLPWIDLARIPLVAGTRHSIRLDWVRDDVAGRFSFTWTPPAQSDATSLWSEVGGGLDYSFVYGPDLHEVVAGYRQLTGRATLMPKWAFGLWQSRERYRTSQESLDVVDGFRSRHIPFDTIVQDWRYWKDDAWGSHEFDPARFPDPAGWVRAIHERNARVVISVWPKFYKGTANYDALLAKGFLYEPNIREGLKDWLGYASTFYDAFNPGARALFWSQIQSTLFPLGMDGWWLDASEPDMTPDPTLPSLRDHMNPTALGPSTRVLNGFALANAKGVYEGQRASAPDRRVVILTRSGFAGQQRYGAATWSGDTSSTWTAMRKQITAGLGFSISGVPYWTMDSGGFSVPERYDNPNPTAAAMDEWAELNTRWFQFATFCPFLRVHGQTPYREMWQFGGDSSPAYAAQLRFDRIRYRLLPYVYSLAGAATWDGAAILRPLVLEFQGDPGARDVRDEFLLGPSLLVSPVTSYQERSRPVYLPAGASWYDFWTGAEAAGGQTVDAAAPFDRIPVHVRAGSIVPTGPETQYAMEKAADPITLFVYAGANGSFRIYEDDGLTNAYEHGAMAWIPVSWDDAARTLTLGRREGGFPGMLERRTFRVVLSAPGHSAGFSFDPAADATLTYSGAPVTAHIP